MCVGLSQNKLQCVCVHGNEGTRQLVLQFGSLMCFWTTIEKENASDCDTQTIHVSSLDTFSAGTGCFMGFDDNNKKNSPDVSLKQSHMFHIIKTHTVIKLIQNK